MSIGVSLTRRSALTRLPVTAFGPASVANLRLWLKADALTPVADATNVTTWTDSSSGGNNAASAGTAPKYYGSVVNGLPIVRYVAGDTRLNSAASASDAAQTIMVVGKVADLSTAHVLVGSQGSGGILLQINTLGQLQLQVQAVTGLGISSGTVTAGTFYVMTATTTTGAQAWWINGTAAGTASNAYSAPGASLRQVGAAASAAQFKGDLAEVINYSAVISGADRIALHAYLGAKYGITMGGS